MRELESVIERAVITSQGTALRVLDLLDAHPDAGEQSREDVKALAGMEQDHILQVLRHPASIR